MDEFAVFSSHPTPDHCAAAVEKTLKTEAVCHPSFMLNIANTSRTDELG
jgi:hypothetical protein